MDLREIKLDYEGAMPDVEIVVEKSCLGRYLIELGGDDLETVETVLAGSIEGLDAVREHITLNSTFARTTNDLRKRMLSWHLLVAPPCSDEEENFSASIRIMQDGRLVEGGLMEFSGTVLRPENLGGVARFV